MENNRMFTSERFKMITDYLKAHSRATIQELSNLLFVSPATIRRDLIEMQKLGMIQRTHGGAVFTEAAEGVSIFARIVKNAEDKEQTATIAIAKLPDFQSAFLDNSSTCLALAERLDLSHKTIITNGLQAAMNLSKKKDLKIILLGGEVQYNTNSADGEIAIEMMKRFKVDLMLSSCASVQLDGTYERGIQIMELKKTAFERSKYHVLLADVHKFYDDGMYRTKTLEDYDAIYTNAPDDVVRAYAKSGAKILNK